MKKNVLKITLCIAVIIIAGMISGCTEFRAGYQVGYGIGAGYDYIGTRSSEYSCKEACVSRGYTSYIYGTDAEACYCK